MQIISFEGSDEVEQLKEPQRSKASTSYRTFHHACMQGFAIVNNFRHADARRYGSWSIMSLRCARFVDRHDWCGTYAKDL